MATYFRARDRREVPATEALDARGVLKSGYGRRVPAQMQDGASRFDWGAQGAPPLVTDARRPGAGNRPGFRVLSDNNPGRQAIADAHSEYVRDLENAWRKPLGLGDAKPPPDEDEEDDDENEGDDNGNGNNRRRRVEASAPYDRRTVDVHATAANHRAKMQTLYDAHALAISEAWGAGKGNK